jgi:hypothetical protein
MYVCMCVCARVRACVRACMRACMYVCYCRVNQIAMHRQILKKLPYLNVHKNSFILHLILAYRQTDRQTLQRDVIAPKRNVRCELDSSGLG